MFNATLAADLYSSSRESFDALVLPTLTPEQVEEVMTLVGSRAREAARAGLVKQCTPDTTAEEVDALSDALSDLAAMVLLTIPHKSSGTNGGWSGYVVRAPFGEYHVKVTLTDKK